jgi:hypothetical protein
VRLSIYNLKGEEVAVVVDEYYQVGNYTEDFKAQGLSSGIYFAYLQEGDKSAAQKLMLLK